MISPTFSAIVPSAGNSRRMDGTDKLTLQISGKPVIYHSVIALAQSGRVSQILIPARPDGIEQMSSILRPISTLYHVDIEVMAGGVERYLSVYNGAVKATGDFLLIHDGARPFLSQEVLKRLFAGLEESNAVIPALPVRDTVKRIDKQGRVTETIDRTGLHLIQTPQLIKRELWLRAFESMGGNFSGVTDDAGMMEMAGYPVSIVPGDPKNIKITFPEDLKFIP